MSALDAARVTAQLQTTRYGRSLRALEQTGSTNDDARSEAASGAVDGHVVVADAQVSGRGSQGRDWQSPGGQDLYVSIVARPRVSMATLPTLTLAVGLGVANAVDELLGAARSRVKWPNDVWVERKKICGILVEAGTTGGETSAIVIGIGLNVNRTQWAGEVAGLATSLRLASGRELERERALSVLLLHVERAVDRWAIEGLEAIVPAVDARLALRGEPVTHDGAPATLLGLAPSGALRLQTEAGVVERVSGRLLPA
jgi:BirA family biotin operon repressor/biotin-[acetyl-CoA-carboxylase] ligase